MSRQLKAIMFTDIKGFSTMMGANEEATVALVREHRALIRATLAEHEGEEHETIGDAFLVLFDSAVNAVQCAVEIQKRFRERNEKKREADQVWIRIGIHLGDIIVQEDGVFGDGVNIAARVEPQAEAGGICITQDVFLQVQRKIGVRAVSIGRKELKNITDAPELYCLLLQSTEDSPTEERAHEVSRGRRVAFWLVGCTTFLLVLMPGEQIAGLLGSSAGRLAQIVALPLLVALIWVLARFSFRGGWNRWLLGDGLFLPACAALVLFLYRYTRYESLLEFAMRDLHAYRALPRDASYSVQVASIISTYINTTTALSILFLLVVFLVLVALLFVAHRDEGKRWFQSPLRAGLFGTLIFGIAIAFLTKLDHAPPLFTVGILVVWLLGVFAVGSATRAQMPTGSTIPAGISLPWIAFKYTLFGMVFLLSLSIALGYVETFIAVANVPAMGKMGMFSKSSQIIGRSFLDQILLVVLLFAIMALWFRKPLFGSSAVAGEIARTCALLLLFIPYPISQYWVFDEDRQQSEQNWSLRGMIPSGRAFLDASPRAWSDLVVKRFVDQLSDRTSSASFGELSSTEELRESLEGCAKTNFETEQEVRCMSPAQAKLYCDAIGARLPTPKEWQRSLSRIPVEATLPNKTQRRERLLLQRFTRVSEREWAMRIAHQSPVFYRVAADEVKETIGSTVSADVGFRCAFTFDH